MRLVSLAAILTALVVRAEDLTPEQRARLQRDQQKAAEAVEKKYGAKKPSELSPEERKALIKEKAAAQREVLEKAGVDAKEFSRSGAKQTRDQKASTDAAAKDLAAKDAAAVDKPSGNKEIVIEKDGDPEVNEAAEIDRRRRLGKQK